MNKQIEALKMAIAEIEGWIDHAYGKTPEECANNKAIQACKEALADAENPELVAVQYLYKFDKDNPEMIPLYTHPTTWQSLSDDEIQNELKNMWDKGLIPSYSIVEFARAIEQALKEKNYG